jgi:hypothetical protein
LGYRNVEQVQMNGHQLVSGREKHGGGSPMQEVNLHGSVNVRVM